MPNLHTKTQVLFVLPLSIYIFATYLQGANLCKSISSLFKKTWVQMPLSWKPMFCLYTSCSNIFKELLKSCSFFLIIADFPGSCKFAPILFAYLTGFSASFDHESTSELEKRFSFNEFLHFVAAILEIVVPLGQRRWPATENSIAQKGLLNYLAFCFACFTKSLISQAFKRLSWYSGAFSCVHLL